MFSQVCVKNSVHKGGVFLWVWGCLALGPGGVYLWVLGVSASGSGEGVSASGSRGCLPLGPADTNRPG